MSPGDPDRRLVRVTAAGAMAAARTRRPRRQGARRPGRGRRHAVDARYRRDGGCSRHRRGREGRGAHALQRRARGGRRRAAGRRRRRSGGRNHADGEEPAGRARRHRAVRARDDVRPRPVRLHGEARRRARRRGRRRPGRADRGGPRRDRPRQGPPDPGSPPSPSSTALGIRSSSAGSWRRARGSVLTRRGCRRGDRGRPGRRAPSTCSSGSAARPRA